jgi:hypothetical protein
VGAPCQCQCRWTCGAVPFVVFRLCHATARRDIPGLLQHGIVLSIERRDILLTD